MQVRTRLQHLWAQLSEWLSDGIDPAIKYGGGEPDVQEQLSEFSRLVESFEDLELRVARLYRAPEADRVTVEGMKGKLKDAKRELRGLLNETMALDLGTEEEDEDALSD